MTLARRLVAGIVLSLVLVALPLAPPAAAQVPERVDAGPCRVEPHLIGIGTSVAVRCGEPGEELLFLKLGRSFDNRVSCTVRLLGGPATDCPQPDRILLP